MEILSYEFNGEGISRVYENGNWVVGLKNWKPANDITGIDCLERHNGTDELFVLLSGECVLISAADNEDEDDLIIKAVNMERNKIYNIPRTLWHKAITKKDTKMVLIEDSSTTIRNTDILPLTDRQIQEIRELVK